MEEPDQQTNRNVFSPNNDEGNNTPYRREKVGFECSWFNILPSEVQSEKYGTIILVQRIYPPLLRNEPPEVARYCCVAFLVQVAHAVGTVVTDCPLAKKPSL